MSCNRVFFFSALAQVSAAEERNRQLSEQLERERRLHASALVGREAETKSRLERVVAHLQVCGVKWHDS